MKNNLRLFFAIPLNNVINDAVEKLLKQLKQQHWSNKVRWVPLKNLHITVRFMGDCPAEKISYLIHEVKSAIKEIKPFTIHLGEIKLFPNPHHPHVVIIDVDPSAVLFQLAFAVEQGVVAAGFQPENRPFLAHLSLGRPNGFIKITGELPHLTANILSVDEIVLMRSDEIDNKRVYEAIEIIELSK